MIHPASAAAAESAKNSIEAAKPEHADRGDLSAAPHIRAIAPVGRRHHPDRRRQREDRPGGPVRRSSSSRVSGGSTADVSMVLPAPTASRQTNSSRKAPRRSGRGCGAEVVSMITGIGPGRDSPQAAPGIGDREAPSPRPRRELRDRLGGVDQRAADGQDEGHRQNRTWAGNHWMGSGGVAPGAGPVPHQVHAGLRRLGSGVAADPAVGETRRHQRRLGRGFELLRLLARRPALAFRSCRP